jgi:hypothetical protein
MNHIDTKAAPPRRPLAISLLLGISGWVAGGFTLMLVGLLFRPEAAHQAALTGAVLLGAAWGLFKADRDDTHTFIAQLALALSIAGQCLVVYAMSKDTQGLAPISGAALLLQAVLALVMPNRLQRTLSTFFALIAWALTVRLTLFGEPGDWYRSAAPHSASLPAALAGWVLAWGPVAALLWLAIRRQALWAGRSWSPLLPPIITGLIVGLAFATLASHPFESFLWFDGQAAMVNHLALWPLLSALGALGALAAAFALRQRGLMALCVAAALLHISHFYFALGTSLLIKSLLMLAIGVVCLAGARVLRAKEAA